MQKLITMTTDFGDGFATSQLEAVVYSLGFNGKLIQNHDVKPYSITEGAYGIWQLAKYCPKNAVHVGVVDPGVGSARAGIVIKTKKSWLVGPDNGLLWPTANAEGVVRCWMLDARKFRKVANTFHGRDIFTKQAVYLARGQDPRGKILDPRYLVKLEFKEGQIVHIDRYGNAKVWGQKIFGLPKVKTFSDVAEGKPLILNGSSDLLELAVNLGNAERYFGLKLGQIMEQ
jgi:S-adenosyl-L-methionine hydrolase (adenosine-forming)